MASIQSRINDISYEIAILGAEATSDPVRQAQIATREQELLNERGTLATRLANENAAYANQLNALDAQIREIEAIPKRVNTQDRELLDAVAAWTAWRHYFAAAADPRHAAMAETADFGSRRHDASIQNYRSILPSRALFAK